MKKPCGRQENIIEKEDTNEHCPYCHCGAKMTWKRRTKWDTTQKSTGVTQRGTP